MITHDLDPGTEIWHLNDRHGAISLTRETVREHAPATSHHVLIHQPDNTLAYIKRSDCYRDRAEARHRAISLMRRRRTARYKKISELRTEIDIIEHALTRLDAL